MKRIIALMLTVLILMLSVSCLFACTEPESTDEGADTENDGGVMLVGVVTDKPELNKIPMQANNGVDYLVNISSDSTQILRNGNKISYTDLEKGEHIRVTHKGIVTRSIPPQVTATKIEVISAQTAKSGDISSDTLSMRARVKSIDGEGVRVEVISSDYAAGDYYFYVGEDTTVYDSTGAVVAFSYVRVGDVVSVTYGDAVTLSLPPKTNAIRIVVE
jgi:hypothetical protein